MMRKVKKSCQMLTGMLSKRSYKSVLKALFFLLLSKLMSYCLLCHNSIMQNISLCVCVCVCVVGDSEDRVLW